MKPKPILVDTSDVCSPSGGGGTLTPQDSLTGVNFINILKAAFLSKNIIQGFTVQYL